MKTTITALCLVACLCATALAEQPRAYGTTVTSYLSLGPDAFQPADDATIYHRDYSLTASFPSDFWVYPQLPSGALVTSIAIDFCGVVGGYGPYLGVELLDRFGNEMGGGSIYVSFPSGCSTETLTDFVPIVINPAENRMAIRVETLGNQNLTGLVIGYQLQVSPRARHGHLQRRADQRFRLPVHRSPRRLRHHRRLWRRQLLPG